MNNRRLTDVVLAFALFVLTGGMIFTFAIRAKAEGDGVMEQTAVVATAIDTTFTYQGSLEDNGSPVTDTCDMQFKLWGGTIGSTQVGSTVTKSNVQVDAGIFSVSLDFGDQFQGDERLLSIAVRCPAGSGSYTDLTGSVFLTAVPYALSLRPGATISSDAVGGGGAVLYVEDTYSGMLKSNAFEGISSEGTGVYGKTSGNSATSYGVHGESEAAGGFGIYSDGAAHVEGPLTWKVMTSYVSVSTAAFIPEGYADIGHVEYNNEGHYLRNESVTDGEYYVAPVQLPHGAVITKVNVGFHDGSDRSSTVWLYRRSMTSVAESPEAMAIIYSEGTSSTIKEGVWFDDNVAYETIDNAGYTYYLEISLPADGQDIELYGVTIEYTIAQPY